MIDYDSTLQIFFAETVKYLEKLQGRAKDKISADRIAAAIDIVRRIAANPVKYADYGTRCREGMENFDFSEAFLRRSGAETDNSAYLSFASVINSMADLNSKFDYQREGAQKKLLAALKSLKYKNSTSMLKDLVFSFRSAESFAVRDVQKQK